MGSAAAQRGRGWFWGLCLSAFFAAAPARAEGDYDPANTRWNGLSSLVELLTREGYQVEVKTELDWSKVPATETLFFFYPTRQGEAAPRPSEVADFLREGGRLLIADDFGDAGETFRILGIERSAALPSGIESYSENPSLPFAEPVPGHPLGAGLDLVLTNHPAVFSSDLTLALVLGRPPASAEPNARLPAVAVEGGLGEGRILAVSDPSIFINSMLSYPGNERLALNLAQHLAGPAPGRGPITIYFGRFAEWGQAEDEPNPSLERFAAIQDFLRSFNEWLAGLARFIPKGELARVMSALVVLSGFLWLLARLVQSPARYDGRWLGAGARHPGPLRPQHEVRETIEPSAPTFQVAVEEFLLPLRPSLVEQLPGDRRAAEKRVKAFMARLTALTPNAPAARVEGVYTEWLALLDAAGLHERWRRRTRG